MATKVIDNNEARVPFFGDKISFVTGLDPLGLQNPSTQAYSYLLPGLNNVTSRIRNYSFYCWLLQEYAKIIESSDPKEQKKFIRRAEYIIALLSVHSGIESISGSNYAVNRFKENLTEFALQTGTYNPDNSTENTYWQYGFGIFGQYYVGSLRQIGLIEEPVNASGEIIGIYRRISKREGIKVTGEDLAIAFDANIQTKNKATFFDCIKKGTVNIKELEELAIDFNLTELKLGNAESTQLIDLLLDIDEPSIVGENTVSMRKETTIHVLKFILKEEDTFDQRSFTMFAYNSKGNYESKLDNCLTGWYYYQLNEYYQVANTAVFNGSLDYLQNLIGAGWMPLPEFVAVCRNEVVKFLIENKVISSDKVSIESIIQSKIGTEKTTYESIMNSKMIERMANGFVLLWQLFRENKENLIYLRTFTNERNIGDNDDVLTYYMSFEKHLNQNVGDFIYGFLSNKTITRHQYVAYRKMGGGSQSTQKFIIEDNYIRQIGNFNPGFTSPRINSLTSFLYDLKLLNDEYKLTKAGEKLLEKYK